VFNVKDLQMVAALLQCSLSGYSAVHVFTAILKEMIQRMFFLASVEGSVVTMTVGSACVRAFRVRVVLVCACVVCVVCVWCVCV